MRLGLNLFTARTPPPLCGRKRKPVPAGDLLLLQFSHPQGLSGGMRRFALWERHGLLLLDRRLQRGDILGHLFLLESRASSRVRRHAPGWPRPRNLRVYAAVRHAPAHGRPAHESGLVGEGVYRLRRRARARSSLRHLSADRRADRCAAYLRWPRRCGKRKFRPSVSRSCGQGGFGFLD
jgi:hypothetical protein